MRIPAAAVALAAALVAGAVPANSAGSYAAVNKAIAAAATADHAPGLQFAVERSGRVVDTYEVGYANLAAKKKVTNATVFALASCSKPFTAMAVMQLVDAHKFSLSTPAFGYLKLKPTHDKRIANITVQELLNHSSGLPREITDNGNDPMNIAKLGAALKKLGFTPGQSTSYSNAGYNVLGAIVAKASGQEYQTYVQSHVFAKAGVHDSAYLGEPAPTGLALGYAGTKVVPNTRYGSRTPAGGWILSASEVMTILGAYDAGKIVSASSRKAMLTPQDSSLPTNGDGGHYGLGWDVVGLPGMTYGKNGDIPGYGAWFERRTSGADFAVLRNSATGTSTHPGGLHAVEAAVDAAH
jgi:putative pyoverdin transport system ATP-binding/permease protein